MSFEVNRCQTLETFKLENSKCKARIHFIHDWYSVNIKGHLRSTHVKRMNISNKNKNLLTLIIRMVIYSIFWCASLASFKKLLKTNYMRKAFINVNQKFFCSFVFCAFFSLFLSCALRHHSGWICHCYQSPLILYWFVKYSNSVISR